jgi:hypothetical protein
LVTGALVACGGSRLPSYGAPQGELMSEGELQGADLIPYRTLTRADFRGSAPTGPASEHTDHVGAQTFALVKHDPGVNFAGRELREPNGESHVRGKIQNLNFRAWMDRSRSWWNPKPSAAPEGYVLQHEQIHFAMVEVEAGAMNREGAALMRRTFEGDDSKEVQRDVDAAIHEIVEGGMTHLLERSRDFDEDTSARYDPAKQNEWHARVERELAQR